MIWLIVVLLPLVFVALLTVVLFVWQHRREPPRVAVLESREPREAVQRSMRRGD